MTSDEFSAEDQEAHDQRVKAFKALAGSCVDFPEIPANPAPNIQRDWE
jgi:hypothetical protein